MFGTLGGPELILILVIALIVFGPKKLPEIGRTLGRMMVEFKKASYEFQRTLDTEVARANADEAAAAATPVLAAAATPVEPPAAVLVPAPPHDAIISRGSDLGAPTATEPAPAPVSLDKLA